MGIDTTLQVANIALFFSFFITMYSLWLNWKQAKVKEIAQKQLTILSDIEDNLLRIEELIKGWKR